MVDGRISRGQIVHLIELMQRFFHFIHSFSIKAHKRDIVHSRCLFLKKCVYWSENYFFFFRKNPPRKLMSSATAATSAAPTIPETEVPAEESELAKL